MMTSYSITSSDPDRHIGDAVEIEPHVTRAFDRTETQCRIAELALFYPNATIGDVADDVDSHPRYVAEIVECASDVQLADMVLSKHGYEPDETRKQAERTGDFTELARLYEEVLPNCDIQSIE
jgi:hypothetical protein